MHEFPLPSEQPGAPGAPPQDRAKSGPRPRLAWRPLAWLAAWCWLMALVPVASGRFGGLAGFGVLVLAVALGGWRIDRWCSRQYWRGLRDYRL